MVFSDQPELFDTPPVTPGCIRYEIGKCIGPCCGACSVSQYGARVRDARAFLEGRHEGPIESLRESMILASELMHFERAASLRDKLQRLEDLREEFTRLRFAVETLSFTYTVKGVEGDDRVYVIKRGLVRAEQQKPKSKKERSAMQELVQSMFAGEAAPAPGVVPTHAIDELMLVSSWFRRHPKELKRTKPLVAYCPVCRRSQSRTTRVTRGVCSMFATWPAPAMTTSCAPGIARAMESACWRSTGISPSPTMINTGTATCGSNCASGA